MRRIAGDSHTHADTQAHSASQHLSISFFAIAALAFARMSPLASLSGRQTRERAIERRARVAAAQQFSGRRLHHQAFRPNRDQNARMNNRNLSLEMLESPHPCSHLRPSLPHRQLTTLSRDTFGALTLTYTSIAPSCLKSVSISCSTIALLHQQQLPSATQPHMFCQSP
jgi:hypothetical protein